MRIENTFGIEAPVRAHVTYNSETALREALLIIRARYPGLPILLVGNGSNLLAGDGRLEIAAIKTCRESEAEYLGDGKIKVPCSMLLSKAAAFALKLSLTGMEFAAGIPGTLGGAIFMNAGAYGGEMKDIVLQTEYLTKDLSESSFPMRSTTSDTGRAFFPAEREWCFRPCCSSRRATAGRYAERWTFWRRREKPLSRWIFRVPAAPSNARQAAMPPRS